ncbi:hypothetical protein GTY54_08740 [Streptomyces sp. SID625]|nr:hypothetical protein [Streptomyces sp. SID625]
MGPDEGLRPLFGLSALFIRQGPPDAPFGDLVAPAVVVRGPGLRDGVQVPAVRGRPPQLPVGLGKGAVVVDEHRHDVRGEVRRRPVACRAPRAAVLARAHRQAPVVARWPEAGVGTLLGVGAANTQAVDLDVTAGLQAAQRRRRRGRGR